MPDFPLTPVAPYLPHSGRMVLLDAVTACDEHGLCAEAAVRPDHILLPPDADALPAYLGMEIMAQGVAAWAGVHAAARGEAVRLGFLLGTRKLKLHCPAIPIGTLLTVRVAQSWQDESGMGVFDCELRCRAPAHGYENDMPSGSLLVSGALNVYSPRSDAALNDLLAA